MDTIMRYYISLLLFFLVLSHSKYVSSEMYEWVDQEGRKHCTNIDPSNSSETQKPGEKSLASIKKENPKNQSNTTPNPPSEDKLREAQEPHKASNAQPQGIKNEAADSIRKQLEQQGLASAYDAVAKEGPAKNIHKELIDMRSDSSFEQEGSCFNITQSLESVLTDQLKKEIMNTRYINCNSRNRVSR